MSDPVGRFAGLDPVTGMLSVPLWTAGALAAVFVVLCVVAFNRAGRDGIAGMLARVALVLVGAGVSWFILEGASRGDLAAERRALDARVSDLLTRAGMPGSALACLDASAGEAVEASCEKALFATPEATAAAVSYASAQLSLLADLTLHVSRAGGGIPVALGSLRRAAESDRYGIVSRVLEVRDGCTPDACAALSLLRDRSRVAANLADHTYDFYVARHAAAWPAGAKSPVASLSVPGEAPATAAATGKPPAGLYFPSSASIPAVNIMDAEPPTGQETTGSAAPPARQAAPPPPPRRPAQAKANGGQAQQSQAKSGGNGQAQPNGQTQPNARPPVDLNALARPTPPAYAPQ